MIFGIFQIYLLDLDSHSVSPQAEELNYYIQILSGVCSQNGVNSFSRLFNVLHLSSRKFNVEWPSRLTEQAGQQTRFVFMDPD